MGYKAREIVRTRGLGRGAEGVGLRVIGKGSKTDFPQAWTKCLSTCPGEEDNGKVLSKDLICWR